MGKAESCKIKVAKLRPVLTRIAKTLTRISNFAIYSVLFIK